MNKSTIDAKAKKKRKEVLVQEEEKRQHAPKYPEESPIPEGKIITTAEEAIEFFTDDMVKARVRRGDSRAKNRKALARRARLAAEKGGKCEMCEYTITDYSKMSLMQFDHYYPRSTHPVSPKTGMKQFVISGSGVANRSWEIVKRHAMEDTRLLCTKCHDKRSDRYLKVEKKRMRETVTESELDSTYTTKSNSS